MTGTVTYNPATFSHDSTIRRVEISFTSTAGGAAGDTSSALNGVIQRVVYVPGTGGTTPSTIAATLKDVDGVDILSGQGAALLGSANTEMDPVTATNNLPRGVAGPLTLAVTGAGNAKTGKFVIYLR